MVNVDFAYLKENDLLKDQYQTAHKIIKLYEIEDYRDVLINARLLLETVVKKIFAWEKLDRYYPVQPGEVRNLRNNTQYLRQNLTYPLSIYNLFDEVRRIGNEAVHSSDYHVNKDQAWHVICDLNDILVFLLNSYASQHLHYMRPDLMLESQDHPEKFAVRKVIHQSTAQEVDNQKLAKEYLRQKKQKRRHFNRLRKFLKH